jgi:hypothetical protein
MVIVSKACADRKGWALRRHVDVFFGRVTMRRDVSLSAMFASGGGWMCWVYEKSSAVFKLKLMH